MYPVIGFRTENFTVADWGIIGRAIMKTLDRALSFFKSLQKLSRVFENLGRVFKKLGQAFERLGHLF